MKPTVNVAKPGATTAAAPAPYVLPQELTSAVATLNEALERRRRLDSATGSAPAEIESITQEVARLRDQLAREQAESALSERGSDHEIDLLKHADRTRLSLESRQRELAGAHHRLASLEAAAPDVDANIVEAGTGLNREIGMFADGYRAALADELRELALPLRTALARAKNIGGGLFDVGFCDTAYLADPRDFMSFGRADYRGENLLDLRCAPGAENDPLVLALQPVREALVALRRHRPFVPLSARPKPYVIKGSNFPGDRAAPPLPPPAPPPPPPKSIEEALRQPYTIRSDSSGQRSRLAPTEMNIAGEIVNNMMRD